MRRHLELRTAALNLGLENSFAEKRSASNGGGGGSSVSGEADELRTDGLRRDAALLFSVVMKALYTQLHGTTQQRGGYTTSAPLCTRWLEPEPLCAAPPAAAAFVALARASASQSKLYYMASRNGAH